MKVWIEPSQIKGTVKIPASKSMVHRAIICASLAQGTSIVSNVTYSKDIDATITCMEALGACIEKKEDRCIIQGCDVTQRNSNICCDCQESGSTMRFLIPLAALSPFKAVLQGHGRLLSRPMDVYQTIFAHQGLSFKQKETIELQGPLQPGHFLIPGDISSQFITGLLLALPLLKKESTLEITEPYQSRSYVELTLQMLQTFGIHIDQTSPTSYVIPGNQTYHATNVNVEGDYSQMAFFGVLGAIQNRIMCKNMDPASRQGDKVILDFLKQGGATVTMGSEICIESGLLNGQTIDLADCPDLGPILCVLAAYSTGTTKLIHARRLRMKESDRIEAMEKELKKWNVDITSTEDTITIHGKPAYRCESPVQIEGHNDHRIVMAMTVFGLCADSPSLITGAHAITKSYPHFFEDIINIQGKVEIV